MRGVGSRIRSHHPPRFSTFPLHIVLLLLYLPTWLRCRLICLRLWAANKRFIPLRSASTTPPAFPGAHHRLFWRHGPSRHRVNPQSRSCIRQSPAWKPPTRNQHLAPQSLVAGHPQPVPSLFRPQSWSPVSGNPLRALLTPRLRFSFTAHLALSFSLSCHAC